MKRGKRTEREIDNVEREGKGEGWGKKEWKRGNKEGGRYFPKVPDKSRYTHVPIGGEFFLRPTTTKKKGGEKSAGEKSWWE